MVPINFEYDPKFLEEEVRDGHLITKKMKKLWLVQMDILNMFINFCDKHGLTYWAEGGTLLGAVRHKGYIPWDDDIDILMMRDDYEKFISLAEKEFEYPYYIESKYESGTFAKIKRLDTTKLKEKIPYIKTPISKPACIGIDIFCADNCPDDENERSDFYVNDILPAWRAYALAKNEYSKEFFNEKKTKADIDALYEDIVKKYFEFENACMEYNDQHTNYIFNSGFPQFPIEEGHLRYREDYDESIYLPFEMLSLRCPKGYERVLDMHYTQRNGIPWQTPVKNFAYHDQEVDEFIDVDKSYIEYTTPLFVRNWDTE